ncbi:MAG TPA: type II secretion system F family protein [Candidatus Dormibacteraeota bacterium]|nr:type II secretion system F family protein [Candidatus Dormibacteraeota bacterium]
MELAVLVAAFFAAGIFMVFIGLSQRSQTQATMQARLRRATQLSSNPNLSRPFGERLLHPLGNYLRGHTDVGRVRGLQLRINSGGRPYNLTVSRLLAVKFVVGGVITLAVSVLLLSVGVTFLVFPRGVSAVILAVLFGLLGYFAPDMVLAHMARERRAAIRRQLPDVCDLLSVFLDAGASFDVAMERLVESPWLAGPLIEELDAVVHSYDLGTDRAAAFTAMAERVGVEDVTGFINAVTRSFRLGTRMTEVMRVQAADIRRRFREHAEEQANTASVKMLFPLVFLIFPTLGLVIMTPALITALGSFSGRH